MNETLGSDWATVGILATPHLLYAFIWYMPHLWMKAFGKKSVEYFETIAWILKGTSSEKHVPMFKNHLGIRTFILPDRTFHTALYCCRSPILRSWLLVSPKMPRRDQY